MAHGEAQTRSIPLYSPLLFHYLHATYLDQGEAHNQFPSTVCSRCGSPPLRPDLPQHISSKFLLTPKRASNLIHSC